MVKQAISPVLDSLDALKTLMQKQHQICDWHDGEPVLFKLVTPSHWVVTYRSGIHYHYDLHDDTWY